MKRKLLKILPPLFAAVVVLGLVVYTLASHDSNIGKTAYSAWLKEGNIGTEAEFLDWIKSVSSQKLANNAASKTPKQDDRVSAYDIWLEEGNSGTEAEFMDWISEMSSRGEGSDNNISHSTPNTTTSNDEVAPTPNAAYDLWLSRGNQGTEADFLSWIRNVSNGSSAHSTPDNNNTPGDDHKCPTCPACPTCPSCPEPGEQPPIAFSGAKFESRTVVFDGSTHEIVVTGVPTGTDIQYSNNRATDMGTHRAFVRLYREDLGERLMTATLTIGRANIEGVTFAGTTLTFNGQVRNIRVAGEIPAGVTVSYTVNGEPFNGAANVGTYNVVATLSGGNFNDLVLSATMMINKANINPMGFMLIDRTVEYTGNNQELVLTILGSLPEGVGVTHVYKDASGNEFNRVSIPGVYRGTVTLEGPNHNPLVLAATLTIANGTIRGITFSDLSVMYDGATYSIEISGTMPAGVSVRYTLGTETGSEFNGVSAQGVYTIVATLTGDHYNKLVLTARLSIVANRLDRVTGIAAAGNSSNISVELSWDAVTNAGSYEIYVSHLDGTPITMFSATGTTFGIQRGLLDFAVRGNYHIEVVAIPRGGDSTWGPSLPSDIFVYEHVGRFSPPANVRIDGDIVRWNTVPGTTSYKVQAVRYDNNGNVLRSWDGEGGNISSISIEDIIKSFNLPAGNYRFMVRASTTTPLPGTGAPIWNPSFESAWSAPTELFRIN
jgi:hypothetical protein